MTQYLENTGPYLGDVISNLNKEHKDKEQKIQLTMKLVPCHPQTTVKKVQHLLRVVT